VNKLLADTAATWDVYNFGDGYTYNKPTVDSPSTPGFTGVDSVDGTDVGSYSEFTLTATDPAVSPHATLNSGAGPILTSGIGVIVRGVRDDWGTKKTGGSDAAVVFNDHRVGEVWCEVVDVATTGCSSTPPEPVTHVTVHINQPFDATHNYVIWENHLTNNTDVLFAPTFTSEDRYGAISKFKFTDTSIHQVRFYITDGRSYDATRITCAKDMVIPISDFSGEVWCDVVSSTPSCTSTQPTENVTVTVYINKGAATTAGWNVGYQSLGSPVGSDSTPNVTAVDDNNSILTWTANNVGVSDKSDFEWLIRNKEDWSSPGGDNHAPGDLIKPTGDSNLKANITGSNVVIWCDATNYANPTYNDPPTPAYKTALVPLVCSQAPMTVTVHYNRPLSELSGWEIAAFGTGVGGDTRVQFTGHDAFGSTAVIHYNPTVTDTGAISFAIRKYQPFVAATDSTLQQNLDPWSCVDGMADCTGGFFRQTTGDRVVPSGANEVWTLTGSSQISDSNYAEDIAMMPSNDIKLTTKALGRGKVRVFATAGAGTTPTAIVIDVLNRKGVSVKPGISCVIGKNDVGTTLASSCDVKGLKKGVKYRLWAHALTYGVGSSAHSRRTGAIPVK